jgi:hypothetical protein
VPVPRVRAIAAARIIVSPGNVETAVGGLLDVQAAQAVWVPDGGKTAGEGDVPGGSNRRRTASTPAVAQRIPATRSYKWYPRRGRRRLVAAPGIGWYLVM